MPLPIIKTLLGVEMGKMLEREDNAHRSIRQQDASNRHHILKGAWGHLVSNFINTTHRSDAIRKSLKPHINTEWAVQNVICDRVCVAYENPPLRRLKGATEAQQEAFSKLVRQSGILTSAKQMLREAFAQNVVMVIPTVIPDRRHGKRLSFRRIMPFHSEVYTHPHDAMGAPVAMSWTEGSSVDFKYGVSSDKEAMLTEDELRYFDFEGIEMRERRFEHGLGVLPAAELRLAERPVDDWWDRHRGSHAVRATIAVGYILTKMHWVRQGQDRIREVLSGKDLKKIPIQMAGTDSPIEIALDPAEVEWLRVEVNTPIKNHREHASYLTSLAAESYGINAHDVDLDLRSVGGEQTSDMASARRHEALSKIRESHIDFLRAWEEDLWWKAALMMRAQGHPLATLLPPELIAESFEVEWRPMSFVDHPKVRLDVLEKEIDLGLKSTFRAYEEMHPRVTQEQARAEVIEIAEEEAELETIYVNRGVPRQKGDRLQNLQQILGRLGGNVGGGRPPENPSDEDQNNDDTE